MKNLKIDNYPEFFGSAKIYSTIKSVMQNFAREVEIDDMIKELLGRNAMTSDYLKKLAVISGRYMNSSKSVKMLMDIKTALAKLIRHSVEPSKLELTKDGSLDMRVMVENLAGTLIKFKVGLKQLDRNETSLIYNPVNNITHTQQIKSQVIGPGSVKSFKFILKPEVFSINDLYELKKENSINMQLGLQIAADGVDGMKTEVFKLPLKILKFKT